MKFFLMLQTKVGGGVLYKDRNIDYVKGTWNQSENEMHINLKELLACMKTSQYFIEKVRKCNLMLNVDSKVTVAWINKRGSIKNPVANELILDLMKVSHKFEIHFKASWIKGSNNVMADSLSRNIINPEIEVSSLLYEYICKKFNMFPTLDLFSNVKNRKCDQFCSSIPSQLSRSRDAFAISWGGQEKF